MMEEYLPYLGKVWKDIDTHQMRVIPIGSVVDTTPNIAPYDQVMSLIKNKKLIVVSPCICRKEQGLLDNPCKKPLETCISFDTSARYYLENGLGRQIDQIELVSILERFVADIEICSDWPRKSNVRAALLALRKKLRWPKQRSKLLKMIKGLDTRTRSLLATQDTGLQFHQLVFQLEMLECAVAGGLFDADKLDVQINELSTLILNYSDISEVL